MQDIISQIFKEANAEEHGGAGFYVLMLLTTGERIGGSIYEPVDGVVKMDVQKNGKVSSVWVNTQYVVSAELEWD